MKYKVRRTEVPPALTPSWSDPIWSSAEIAPIDQFHSKSSSHRPVTMVKMLHNDDELFVQFQVQDRFIRCVQTDFQSMVCKDSCVEFFLRPRADAGYFNFEINCGGALLVYYIEDPTRTPTAFFRKFTVIPEEQGRLVRIASSLPTMIEPEITQPTTWGLTCAIPLAFFEEYVGKLRPLSGQQWLGNFFKCGDETSHPHWASWNGIGETLRFHQPEYFAQIAFD